MDISDPRVDPALVPPGSVARVIAETQEEYRNLPAIITPLRQVITRWTPTPEERGAILSGEDIYVTILGTPIRPMYVTVGVVDWALVERELL